MQSLSFRDQVLRSASCVDRPMNSLIRSTQKKSSQRPRTSVTVKERHTKYSRSCHQRRNRRFSPVIGSVEYKSRIIKFQSAATQKDFQRLQKRSQRLQRKFQKCRNEISARAKRSRKRATIGKQTISQISNSYVQTIKKKTSRK